MDMVIITEDQLQSILRKLIQEELKAFAGAPVSQAINNEQVVLTLSEARDLLKISDSTIRRMIREKEIPSFSVRTRIYIRKSDIDSWMQSQIEAI